MPPRYVKPYVKRQKNDAADAEAICEAVARPNMRFVEIKSCEQQGVLVLHRVRLLLMRHRIALSNAIRGHMAEYGLVAPVGHNGPQRSIAIISDQDDDRLPPMARASLIILVSQFQWVDAMPIGCLNFFGSPSKEGRNISAVTNVQIREMTSNFPMLAVPG